jgi:hypothetical protein
LRITAGLPHAAAAKKTTRPRRAASVPKGRRRASA